MGPSFMDYIVYRANYIFRPAALVVDMNSNPSAVENGNAPLSEAPMSPARQSQ